jgi:hypothetical protein
MPLKLALVRGRGAHTCIQTCASPDGKKERKKRWLYLDHTKIMTKIVEMLEHQGW